MTQTENLKLLILEALRDKNQLRLDTLRSIISGISMYEKNNVEITDDIFIQVILKQIKIRKEAIESAIKYNRSDIEKIESEQLLILEQFLPTQMSEEDLIDEIKSIIVEINSNIFNKVISIVMKRTKGKVDSKLVNKIVSQLTIK